MRDATGKQNKISNSLHQHFESNASTQQCMNWWLRLGYRIAHQIKRNTHELSPCDAKEPHIGAVEFWHQPDCWAARINRIGCWHR
jgi:hypothetical protein